MTALTVDLIDQIREQHQLAQSAATSAKASASAAVQHAVLAGGMLLQVKAQIGHGAFLPWVADNFTFTARTAQRYMNAAAPKPNATACRISPRSAARPPKLGKAKAAAMSRLDQVQRRDTVYAHVLYLVGGDMPPADVLQPEHLDALTKLRDQLDQLLGQQR